jgi:SAM-dependent methyltransferase
MDNKAFQQYSGESNSWLHNSRREFMFRMLADVCSIKGGMSILEIGAGVGQNTTALNRLGEVDVIEINDSGIEVLKSIPMIRNIFTSPIPFALEESYNLVVAMDVLEHIQNDQVAADWIVNRLRPGGILFLTVPAYQWLFSEHDVALHHFRRYNVHTIGRLLSSNLNILRSGYFNCILFPIAAALRLTRILFSTWAHRSEFQPRKCSSKLPIFLDRLFRDVLKMEIRLITRGVDFPFGLSVFCVAELPRS